MSTRQTLLIILLLAAPCLATEEGPLEKAYREVYEQSQRIRERQADYFRWQEEFDRRDREFERNYEGDDHYDDCDHDTEDHQDWDDYDRADD